jgi:hypothetical protein
MLVVGGYVSIKGCSSNVMINISAISVRIYDAVFLLSSVLFFPG